MVFDFDVYLIEMLRETSYFEKNKYPNNAKVPTATIWLSK